MGSIVRWNPFEELGAVPSREWLGRLGFGAESAWQPRVDVAEREDANVARAELPGVEAKEIERVEASRKDGVLAVWLAKRGIAPKEAPKEVTIRTS